MYSSEAIFALVSSRFQPAGIIRIKLLYRGPLCIALFEIFVVVQVAVVGRDTIEVAHIFGLGDGDLLDVTGAAIQTSTVAIGMVALGLWAGTDINHAALQRFKATKSRFKRHYVPFNVQYSRAAFKGSKGYGAVAKKLNSSSTLANAFSGTFGGITFARICVRLTDSNILLISSGTLVIST